MYLKKKVEILTPGGGIQILIFLTSKLVHMAPISIHSMDMVRVLEWSQKTS